MKRLEHVKYLINLLRTHSWVRAAPECLSPVCRWVNPEWVSLVWVCLQDKGSFTEFN